MNKEIKQKWVDELRSGRYSQGKGQLCKGDDYCCLGVLCEIAQQEGFVAKFECSLSKGSDHENKTFLYGFARHYLPNEVEEWAELPSSAEVLYKAKRSTLPYLNDTENLNFAEIADIIENQL